MELDPLRHPFWKSGDELLQHHKVYHILGSVSVSQQPSLAGVLKLLGAKASGRLSSLKISDRKY